MMWIKYCLECGEAFDQNTEKDYCPKCRKEKGVEY